MREIIAWLQRVEGAAAEVYNLAAGRFSDDVEFSTFLRRLRDDECEHLNIARIAGGVMEKGVALPCIISIDGPEMSYIEDFLIFLRNRVKTGKVTKEGMLHYMITIESKECNDFLAYIVNWLYRNGYVQTTAAGQIGSHKKAMEEYLETIRWNGTLIHRLDAVSPLRGKKLLVVSDDNLIEDGLKAIYEGEDVTLESAVAKKDLLGMIGKGEYSAIVADADGPGLDLKDFYTEAVGLRPEMRQRLVLFTKKPEAHQFFFSNGLRFLGKPTSIQAIKKALQEVAL
ncbi:MAG TPA: hypothetical protein DDW94_06885 [Deltaproteobacteria bacterium]|nr:MAG: hypothetical protein A2Z79_01415 [Deltaproteobacteria bacterium GWA2_55_82]OGQ62054.1 MAG: hypothetical protein A3I81_03790 [Deltaproteobacteria bacterium RIFCSPLOWO2_02_FULL_55_12]OIJ74089.1 MAG: hypothetical protein A2V21_307325 [Deltaproteobacteria bacterium GWC2_55_46]HBG46702.1 hypothetical protein [Deltaproteobacteria bacterium]HCY11290.1 hypothetical protein [Deltaproteobacteria bacterium]